MFSCNSKHTPGTLLGSESMAVASLDRSTGSRVKGKEEAWLLLGQTGPATDTLPITTGKWGEIKKREREGEEGREVGEGGKEEEKDGGGKVKGGKKKISDYF